MKKRSISRAAFLLSFDGRPESLADELPEIAAGGYAMVMLSGIHDLPETLKVAQGAAELGLEVGIFTAFMKYQYKYLAEHPEQRMVFAQEALDQDGLSTSRWGCPFNPDFKARYLATLTELAVFPGVTHIDLNDEAYLGNGCYCAVCTDAYQAEIGGEMPCKPTPQASDWEDPRWREYLIWRMSRWNAVHREMADTIREANPAVKVSFQSSPSVDMWMNPWHSAVDLAAMAEFLDRLCTDPYYTFHQRIFDPPEVYLSEWCRFLAGIVPEGKEAAIIPQGFTHPTFTRPLGEADGAWSAIVPPACGVNLIAPFTYTLQRCSPAHETYEACWQKLDPFFEQALPMKYAGVVHGIQSEVLRYPLPLEVPHSYDGTRLFPVAESLRQGGLPYGFLSDAKLADQTALSEYRVVTCPEIACMSPAEREGFSAFIRSGGNAVILGELGAADDTGAESDVSLLTELFHIEQRSEPGGTRRFEMTADHPAARKIVYPDKETAERYMAGANAPLFTLAHSRTATLPGDATVLAEFCDEQGVNTGQPAIVTLERYGGRVAWLAGFPTRTTVNTIYGTGVRNLAHQLFAHLVQWAAGESPVLRTEGWPPSTPINELRPIDQRFMPTCEFFPLEGDDAFMAVVTSYFREPARFPIILDVPQGRSVTTVRELIADTEIPYEERGGQVAVTVELTFDTPALVYWIELA